jgi:dihydroneopterin aldolase
MHSYYRYVFSLNRLQLAVHLGYYEAERRTPQPVEVNARLYFPGAPICTQDDYAKFIDYAKLAEIMQRVVAAKEFRLIEFLTMEMFTALRAFLDTQPAPEPKLWLRVTKLNTPVPNLNGGASFTTSDLPADFRAISAQ